MCGSKGVPMFWVNPPQGAISPPEICQPCAVRLGRIALAYNDDMAEAERLLRTGHVTLAASLVARTLSDADRRRNAFRSSTLRALARSREAELAEFPDVWRQWPGARLRELRAHLNDVRRRLGHPLHIAEKREFQGDEILKGINLDWWDDTELWRLNRFCDIVEEVAELDREADEILISDDDEGTFSDPNWIRRFFYGDMAEDDDQ
jgi:hypothetical protein